MASFEPVFSHIGVMESSAPKVKNIMPMISMTAPTRNRSKILGGIGVIVKPRSKTIPMIGRTASNCEKC